MSKPSVRIVSAAALVLSFVVVLAGAGPASAANDPGPSGGSRTSSWCRIIHWC